MLAPELSSVVSKNICRPDDKEARPDISQSMLLERIHRCHRAWWHKISQENQVTGQPAHINESENCCGDVRDCGRRVLGAEKQAEKGSTDSESEEEREVIGAPG